MAAPAIDPREWTATVALLKQYELHQRPEVAVLLAMTDPARPTPGNLARFGELRAIASAAAAFHQEHPLLVAPPGTLDRDVFSLDARQIADGQAITLPESRVAQHVGIFGRSGEGKTTIAQRFAISAYERNLSVITIDAKHDAQHLAVHYPETAVITPTTPIPFLEQPSWLNEHETRR
jgi:Helicase HerA, central domain